MNILADIFLCFCDFFRILIFYWVLNDKKKMKLNLEVVLLILLGVGLDYALTVGMSVHYIYVELFVILVCCFIGVRAHAFSIYAAFIYSLLYVLIGHFVSLIETSIYSGVLNVSFMHLSAANQFAISLIYQLVCILVSVVCARYYRGLGKEKDTKLLQQLVLLLTPTTVLYTEIFYYSFMESADGTYTMLSFLASISCFTIIYIGKEICLQKEKELQNALVMQKLDSTKQYAEDISVYYEKAREIRHDMKSYWQMMDVLLEEGKVKEAQEIVKEQSSMLHINKVIPYSGNTYLDAILYQNVTSHPDIDFQIQIQDLSDIYMDTMDFCSLFINLLSNAVEGAKGDHKYVNVRVEQDRYKLSICVSNPITYEKSLETEKQDKANHGLGMNIIHKIVDNYDGEVFIQQKNQTFVIKIMISNQEMS